MATVIRSGYVLALLTLIPLLGCARGGKREVEEEERRPTFQGLETSIVVQVDPTELQLHQGGKGKLEVTVIRRAFQGPVTLEARNLPTDVTAPKVTVPAGQTTAEFELTATPTAGSGKRSDSTIEGTTSSGLKGTSPPLRISVQGAPFTLTTSLATLRVGKGIRSKLRVSATRKGYQGPITVELTNLPPGIEPIKATIPEGKDSVELELAATPKTPPGDRPNIRVIGFARTGGATYRDTTGFTLSVQPPPFALQVEPTALRVGQGGKALLKVNVLRKGYQGSIDVMIPNLPAGVTMPKHTIAPYLRVDEIPLTATVQAPLGDKKGLQVVGTATDASRYQAASPAFAVRVHPGLQLQPAPQAVRITQGGKARLKITPVRTGYKGPFTVDLVGLPAGVTAPRVNIPSFKDAEEVELTAAADAVPQGNGRVQLIARIPDMGNHQMAAAEVKVIVAAALRVVPVPFTLQVEPAALKLAPGSKARLKVNAIRKDYQGPIRLEVHNLPANVSAAKATIPEKQNAVDVELTATASASGEKKDVNVQGTGQADEKGESPNIVVSVQTKPFELRVQPAMVRLTSGTSAVLKVQANRKNYQGPIALELRNLPAGVRAAKAVIAAGQNEVNVQVSAEESAAPVVRNDVQVVGSADRKQVASSPLTISVTAGQFDLKIEPALVKLKHGGSATVKVSARRKGYQGPIAVTLRNLPADVAAAKATIAKGQDAVEIEVKAGNAANEGDTVDVHAQSGQASTGCITVCILSASQPPFDVKVEPAVCKLTPGSTSKLKVTVVRTKAYDGPITLEVRNLPAGVSAAKVTVPMRQTTAEIALTAAVFAGEETRTDTCVVGTASGGAKQSLASPHLQVAITSK